MDNIDDDSDTSSDVDSDCIEILNACIKVQDEQITNLINENNILKNRILNLKSIINSKLPAHLNNIIDFL